MSTFYMGMAKRDITPPIGTLLAGYPSRRESKKILDRLSVNAIAVKQNDNTVVFISAELCNVSTEHCEYVAQAVAKDMGIKKENVLYSCIHTHSGPITKTSVGWGVANTDYVENTLIPQSIEAAKEAIENLQPALLAIGSADSYAGINRRELTAEGKIKLGQNPDGPYNPKMIAFVFKNTNGENIGTMIHFALHPTSAGDILCISRDWPGYMIDHIEKITDAPCMYVNGAEGDIGPRLTNGKTIGQDEKYIEEIGLIAAKDAEIAVGNATDFKEPKLKTYSGTITLPFIEMPTLDKINADIEALGDPTKLQDVQKTALARFEKLKELHASGEEIPTSLKLSQTVVAFDDVAIVPFPFEMFCNIALSLGEKSPFGETILLGLTGGSRGYIPTEDELENGGYEVASFRAATIPGFVDNLDKCLVDESVKNLNELYKK